MATDPGAARQGLATFENIYWIAGGGLADGSLASLSTLMPRVAKAYLIGESAETFAAALKGRVVAAICRDLTTAVARAAADAETAKRADPVVLLSPACPAGEQFADAAARGAAFRQIVESLPGVAISGAAA
jgi:UDP-N-acetylmuramoylalanine--D-glutamate ligase